MAISQAQRNMTQVYTARVVGLTPPVAPASMILARIVVVATAVIISAHNLEDLAQTQDEATRTIVLLAMSNRRQPSLRCPDSPTPRFAASTKRRLLMWIRRYVEVSKRTPGPF